MTSSTQESSLLTSSSLVGSQHRPQPVCRRLSLDSRTSISKDDVTYGLLITLNDTTGQVELSFCPDAKYPDLHPNAYAPATLTQLHKLGGGGSGVAVFEGHHPTLGDIVMKHGGDKDLKELFALATIAEELQVRRKNNPGSDQAARDLQERIPEFKMIYISPHHLGEKRRELWYKLSHLYKYSSRNLLVLPEEQEEMDRDNTITTSKRLSASEFAAAKPSSPARKAKSDDATTTNTVTTRRSSSSSINSMGSSNSLSGGSGSTRQRQHAMRHVPSRNGLNVTQSGTVTGHRDISIYNTTTDDDDCPCRVELLGDSLTISVPASCESDGWMESIVIPGDGYTTLKSIVRDVVQLMKEHKWKLTLAQKRIGGKNPQTGNMWLYAGALEGKLLDNLITQKIQLVRNLATLTTPAENDPEFLRQVQYEVMRFEEESNITPGDISPLTDSFVGNAIKKNFQQGTGRFPILGQLGRQFREFTPMHHPELLHQRNRQFALNVMGIGSSHHSGTHLPSLAPATDDIVLTPDEEIPAFYLGKLTRLGALMGDTFENVSQEPTVLEMNPFYWRNIVRAAVQPRQQEFMSRTSTMALTRIWTCGLTDAGVHNLFLTEDSISLFDLGQPQLYSAPGFLTKFLFSFFHTLGMEETGDESGSWVRRFDHNPETNKLRLTRETQTLLAKAYDAFETTLDRLIDELFDRDDSLRWLLIQYMTLQLLSDASFCLQRWTIKGGGRAREENHHNSLQKWLWRALWDMYIAFDLNTSETWTRLYVEHPSHRESAFFADMRDLIHPEYLAALERIDEKESKQEELAV